MGKGNPQKEDGMTPIANELLEALMKQKLNGYEFRTVLAIARKTYGWSKKTDYIAVSQLAELTGLQRPHASRAFNALLRAKVCTKSGTHIGINKKYSEWESVPNQVRTKLGTESGEKRTVLGSTRTESGTESVPNQAPQKKKETIQKQTTSKDVGKTGANGGVEKVTRGDPNVNEFLQSLQETFGLQILDGSARYNRRFAYLSLQKFGGIDACKKIMLCAKASDFWRGKIAGAKDIYYNAVKIVAAFKSSKESKVPQGISI